MQLHINTYGTYVHVKDQMFDIRLREKDGQIKSTPYSASKVTSIVMATGVSLSTDAVRLALQHNVDLLFVEQDGTPMGRVWHSKLGSTTKIRKAQLVASLDATGLQWTRTWLLAKLDNQVQFVKGLKKHRPQHTTYLDDKITRMEALAVSISSLEAARVSDVADTLRGLEGTAGRLYFETLSYVLPADYAFSGRSSRPAQDAFNAFLNYAYGMLYGKIEKTLILAGIDPYLGFMHRDDYNQLSMVYDFIEPYRAYADEVVFRLFSAKKVNILNRNGEPTERSHISPVSGNKTGQSRPGQSRPGQSRPGVSLNAEGKMLLVTAYNEFMDGDPVRYKGRNLTRSHCIQLDAHQFANALIERGINQEREKRDEGGTRTDYQ